MPTGGLEPRRAPGAPEVGRPRRDRSPRDLLEAAPAARAEAVRAVRVADVVEVDPVDIRTSWTTSRSASRSSESSGWEGQSQGSSAPAALAWRRPPSGAGRRTLGAAPRLKSTFQTWTSRPWRRAAARQSAIWSPSRATRSRTGRISLGQSATPPQSALGMTAVNPASFRRRIASPHPCRTGRRRSGTRRHGTRRSGPPGPGEGVEHERGRLPREGGHRHRLARLQPGEGGRRAASAAASDGSTSGARPAAFALARIPSRASSKLRHREIAPSRSIDRRAAVSTDGGWNAPARARRRLSTPSGSSSRSTCVIQAPVPERMTAG